MLTKKTVFKLTLAATIVATGAFAEKKKSYENFELPKAGRANLSDSRVFVDSSRLKLKGKNIRVDVPSFNLNEYLAARDTFLTEKREETIKILRQQMDSGLRNNRDNMLLRLGQLYIEKYIELSFRENELYTQRLLEFDKKHEKGAKQPVLDNSRSKTYMKDALALFYSIEKEYPRHPKMDEVIFFIGFVEMEQGNTAKGSKYLERMIRQYPRSRKFDEAVVYLGDYYFDNSRFAEARGKYQVLLSRKDSSLHDYAEYKMAWCELNLGAPTKGLRRMKDLVNRLADTKEKAKFNLREQALRDLVFFFSEVESVEEAIAFFTEAQGKEKAFENLKMIAETLRTKAKDAAAVVAYKKLLEEYGDSPEAPKFEMGLFDVQSRLGTGDKGANSMVRALEKYNPTSDWAKSFPAEKSKELKETLDTLQAEALKSALNFHQSGQKANSKKGYENALKIYTALLTYFPTHPDKKKISFYRGEILYNQGKFLDAANAYMDAAKIPPKDKLTDDAAYAALLSVDQLMEKQEQLKRYTKEEQKQVSTEPEEIPVSEKRFIEIAEYYITENPKSARVVDVRFRIAGIYYRHRQFDKALEGFLYIVNNHPKHRSATTAANLVLDIYNIQKNYDKLNETAVAFMKNPQLGDAEFKAELATISDQIGFKKVEGLETNNQWDEAGESYYKFYSNNPKGTLAEKSLYNAYVSFEKAGNTARASEVANLFVSKFPKSQYTKSLLLGQAKAAEKEFDFERAQRSFESFHRQFPQDKEAKKALYNAALFAELLEQNTTATNLYNEYLREKSISESERKAIQISLAKIARKQGRSDQAIGIYRRLGKDAKNTPDKLSYLAEIARLYEKDGKTNEKTYTIKEIRAQYSPAMAKKVTVLVSEYAAEAEFRSIENQKKKYNEIKLRFPPEDLVYLLKRKEKALAKLSESYDKVVEFGVPEWGVAALSEKNEAYDNFVKGFRAVQLPKSYTGQVKTDAENALKGIDAKVIKPIEDKGKEIADACAARAAQFHVVTKYASSCRSKGVQTKSSDPTGILPEANYTSTRWLDQEVARQ